MTYKFIEDHFEPPFKVEEENFIIRKLTVDEVEKDYAAVMSSKESLRQVFSAHDTWPSDDMSLEQNYNDLKRHEEEFDKRQGFAYTVVNKEDTECIGCIYIWPWTHGIYDALVYYWVTDKVKALGFDEALGLYLDQWFNELWSFKNPLYPGRNLDFDSSEKLSEEKS